MASAATTIMDDGPNLPTPCMKYLALSRESGKALGAEGTSGVLCLRVEKARASCAYLPCDAVSESNRFGHPVALRCDRQYVRADIRPSYYRKPLPRFSRGLSVLAPNGASMRFCRP